MGTAPHSIPLGAEAVVLYGDPSKDEMFAMRLKFPKGYKIAPHQRPKPEVLTVITGTFRLGMGETADPSKATAFPAGSFVALSPGMAHFASADDDTVVQLNSTGPWTLNYVNPADDPRKSRLGHDLAPGGGRRGILVLSPLPENCGKRFRSRALFTRYPAPKLLHREIGERRRPANENKAV